MPYRAEWHIPYRVINARVWGHVTAEDLKEHTNRRSAMLAEAGLHAPDKRVHLLYDALDAHSHPATYFDISQAMPILRSKNRGPMYLITTSDEIKSILELTAYVLDYQLLVFSTKEAALQVIEMALIKEDLNASATSTSS